MTRDELEALIWRYLTAALGGHITQLEFTDAILRAADVYALTAYGITAERRADLAANAYLHREVKT